MAKTLSGIIVPWTIWKRTGAFRHISFSKGLTLFSENKGDMVKYGFHEDIVNQDLKAAESPVAILKLVDQNYKTMQSKHVVQALKSIYYMEKNGKNVSVAIGNILKHQSFGKLCQRLKYQSGVLDINDIVESLKILSYVKVPSNSNIIQILLQLVRHNVNSLNIQQILFLDYLLANLQPDPLVNALKIALPLVFDIQLAQKMNRRNSSHMAECLVFASKHKLNEDTHNLILNSLEKCSEEFEPQTAKNIIWSLCHTPRNAKVETFYRKCVTDLCVNFDSLTDRDVDLTLHKMAHQYTTQYPFYYQEVFFDVCANHCVDNKVGLQRSLSILRHMARVHHFHKNILDYVSTLIYVNPSIKCTSADCYSLVIGLVLSDYRPIHFHSIVEWIKNAKDLATENRNEIIWIRFAAALCLLDIYKLDVLSRTLQKSYLDHLFTKGFMSDYEHYFTIWKSITKYKPELKDLLPSSLEPKDLIHSVKQWKKINPFKAALEKGLGGEQYLLTNLYTQFGDIIDHAVVLMKNGDPIPLPDNVKFVEELTVHEGDALVLILGINHYYYTRNTNMLRSSIIRTINILESTLTNCYVIPVSVKNWQELTEIEKIPYLMQKIKEKVVLDLNLNKNVVCD